VKKQTYQHFLISVISKCSGTGKNTITIGIIIIIITNATTATGLYAPATKTGAVWYPAVVVAVTKMISIITRTTIEIIM
jgi:hypothetical protein